MCCSVVTFVSLLLIYYLCTELKLEATKYLSRKCSPPSDFTLYFSFNLNETPWSQDYNLLTTTLDFTTKQV